MHMHTHQNDAHAHAHACADTQAEHQAHATMHACARITSQNHAMRADFHSRARHASGNKSSQKCLHACTHCFSRYRETPVKAGQHCTCVGPDPTS